MPSIYDQIRADFDRGVRTIEDRITRHQSPAAQAADAAPTEEHMSLLDELKSFENKVITIGEEDIEKVGVIKSTPEGAELIDVAHRIVTAVIAGHVAPSTLAGALAGLRTVGELVQGYVSAAEARAAQQAQEAPAA